MKVQTRQHLWLKMDVEELILAGNILVLKNSNYIPRVFKLSVSGVK